MCDDSRKRYTSSVMANTELTQFVAAERMRGVADDAIQKSLVEKGWRAEDVSAALSGNASEHAGDFSFKHLFEGRMGRMEYFLTQLLLSLIFLLATVAFLAILFFSAGPGWGVFVGAILIFGALGLLSLPFSLGITVRRLHDVGASGWFVLLTFVPMVNFIMWVALLFIPGNVGANAYGMPAPKRSTWRALINS